MDTNLRNTNETNRETTVPTMADFGLAVVLELLATGGLAAEAVFDGDAEGCPHCVMQDLSEAA